MPKLFLGCPPALVVDVIGRTCLQGLFVELIGRAYWWILVVFPNKQRNSIGHLEKLALVWPLALSTPIAAVGLAGWPERNT